MRVLPPFLLCLVLLSQTCVADDQADARALVEKAIAAIGGEAKLAKFTAETWKSKGTYYGMGDGVPYTGNYSLHWPGKFRMEIEGVFVIVLNNDKGWVKAGDMVTELNADQFKHQQEEHYGGWVASLLPLKEKEFKLSTTGESKIDNRDCLGVRVSREMHRDVNLYFDKQTGLLAKCEHNVNAPELGDKDVLQEVFYAGYQEADGVKVATKVTLKRDGKLFVEAENSDIKAHGTLDDSVFAKP